MASLFDDIFRPAPTPSPTGQAGLSSGIGGYKSLQDYINSLLKPTGAATGTAYPNAQSTDLMQMLLSGQTPSAKPPQATDITQMPVTAPVPAPPGYGDRQRDVIDPYMDLYQTAPPVSSPPGLTNTGLPQVAPPPPMNGISQASPLVPLPAPPVQASPLTDNLNDVRGESRNLRYAGGPRFNETTGQPVAMAPPQTVKTPVVSAPPMTGFIPPPSLLPPDQLEGPVRDTLAPVTMQPPVQVQPEVTAKAEPKLMQPPVTTTTPTNTSTGSPPPPPPSPPPTAPPRTDNLNDVRAETRDVQQPTPTLTPNPVPTLTLVVGKGPTTPLPTAGAKPGVTPITYTPPEAGPVQARRDLPTAPKTIEYSPPTAGTVQTRRDVPTAPDLTQGNVGDYLSKQGIADTNLPTLPQSRAGTFEEYLTKNNLKTLTPEEIAAQAKRVREMQFGEAMSKVEQERLAAQQRNALAQQQAGTGLDSTLNDLDNAVRRQLEYLNAQNMQRGLTMTNSNIPVERDFNPLLYNYAKQRGSIQQSVQDKINQLRLEGQISDQQAAQMLVDLERQGGLTEAQTTADLQTRERQAGEQARQSRFGEFAGIEDVNRQRGVDEFGAESTLAQLNEAIRQGRGEEFFRQAGLNQSTSQQNFANESTLAQLVEEQRQADIRNNLANRQQGLSEYSTKSDVANRGFANEATIAQLVEEQRQADIRNNLAGRQQGLSEYSTKSGVANDLTRLQDQLQTSELERALATRQGEMEGDPNSLANLLKAAQVREAEARAQNSLAQAARGGLGADEVFKFTSDITPRIVSSIQVAADPAATDQDKSIAKAVLQQYKQQYDSLNGSGAFDRTFGAVLEAALNPPPEVRGPSFGEWFRGLLGQLPAGSSPTQGLLR